MTGSLRQLRRAALIAIGVLVTAASVTSFAESYRGLFLWAGEHGLSGIWAAGFPLQVDVFVAVGELALFVALADRWQVRSRVAAWGVTVAGLAVSVAGNVGHIAGHDLASRATAAVPPLAAAAALAVGLGVLKRVVAMHASACAPEPHPAAPEAETCEAAADCETHDRRVLAWLAGFSRPASGMPELDGAPEPDAPHPLAIGDAPDAPDGGQEAARIYAGELTAGDIPSVRRIRRELHVGQPRAQEVHAYLTALAHTR